MRLADAGFEPLASGPPAHGRRFRVDPASRLFDGHFEGTPILPGVAQIVLAVDVGRDGRAATDDCLGLRDVRVLHPIGPGETIDVICAPGANPAEVRFEIRGLGRTLTTGVLLFGSRDAVAP